MKDSNSYQFKGATIEEATAKGLAELGLTEEQVDIEVKSYGGIFTKPCVIITPKAVEEVAEEAKEEVVEAAPEEAEEAFEEEAKPEKQIETDEAVLDEAQAKALEFVKGLVANMNLAVEVEAKREDGEIIISVSGENAGNLIGYRGEALDAIQYYTLLVCNKSENPFIRVQVDAENYRGKRKETLSALALRLAKKAAKTNRAVSLEPMNPFERRVIHTALAEDRFVTTKSEGEGRFRHVVITPKDRPTRRDRGDRAGRKPHEHRSERHYDYDDEVMVTPKAPVEEAPIEMSYGSGSDFRKKGPTKMRSFGGKAKRF